MGKTFFKNLYRDIKRTRSRFLSIIIIIAVGVAFYSGVRSTSPDMKRSGDYYFNKNNLMDFKLISTLGVSEEDLRKAKGIEGVTKVLGSYSLDAVTNIDERMVVLNINSLPLEDGINDLRIVSGRRVIKDNEAVVEHRFFKENMFKLGDKLLLSSGNESNLEDRLKYTEFEIVGTALCPLYVSGQRMLSSVGSGTVRGFVYILPQVFKSETYTEIYVKTDSEESNNSLLLNERYKEVSSPIEKRLNDLAEVRREERYDEVLKEAEEKIQEGEEKLKALQKEAEEKFTDGYNKLRAAKNKIDSGKEELLSKEILFKKGIIEGEKAIIEGKEKILVGEASIEKASKEIEEGKLKIAGGKKALDIGDRKLLEGKTEAAKKISEFFESKLEELKAVKNKNPLNLVNSIQYAQLKKLYEHAIKDRGFDSMYVALDRDGVLKVINEHFDLTALKNEFESAEREINAGKNEIYAKEQQLSKAEKEIAEGRAALEDNKAKIAVAEEELKANKSEGVGKLNERKDMLEAAERELEEGFERLRIEEEKAKTMLAEGEAKIRESRAKLKELSKPQYFVLGRSSNIGYETYRQDSDRINNIGKVFPLIFFLVAALVSLTTMTRMVQEKRVEIGTFKAMGYSRAAIVCHYLIYSLSASIIGSIMGMVIGFRLFPPLIMNAYGSLYTMPETVITFNRTLGIQSTMLAVILTTAAAAVSTMDELREVPATLMRPRPPKSGKSIVLEKIPFLWKRLSFTRKVTARNIFRYKQRFFMTVIGIAACTGLMITAFGIKCGIRDAMERQFNKIYLYDLQGNLTKSVNMDEKENVKKRLLENSNAESVLLGYTKNSSVKRDGGEKEDLYLIVPEENHGIKNYVNLNSKGKDINIEDNGVIITEKLSRLIEKKEGDELELTINEKVFTVRVSSVTEHYVHHHIYMSSHYYKEVIGEEPIYNSFYGLLKGVSEEDADNAIEKMMAIEGVGSVSLKYNTRYDLNKSLESINTVVLVLIASAGVLAFVVIYNLTNININERRRELATIKLLGFYNKELAYYIYRENIILTIIGTAGGILLGKVLNNFVINSAETNVMLFVRDIQPIYFIYSAALTIFFSIIVNIAMYWRFDKIDMIESLKSAE
jgi:putative ABC transport system permease protein